MAEIIPPLVISGCNHHWFEVGKTSRHLCEKEGKTCIQHCLNYEYGVHIGCATCNQRRILWLNGEIEGVSNNGN